MTVETEERDGRLVSLFGLLRGLVHRWAAHDGLRLLGLVTALD